MTGVSLNQANMNRGAGRVLAEISAHFWFKSLGTTGFTVVFFSAYIFLLKHPSFPVTVIPPVWLDRLIGVEPLALPLYLSLWLYLSLPVMRMTSRPLVVEYGLWIGALCLAGLTMFYFWPTAVPPAQVDWARYPEMALLKGVDAAGNACPSLHVATALFACFWLDRQLGASGIGRRIRILNLLWCAGIVYSTMATKQHMALDVAGGIALALVFALARDRAVHRRKEAAGGQSWFGRSALERE